MVKLREVIQDGHQMNSSFFKFFLGFFVIVILFDLMLIDRKSEDENMMDLFATFNKTDGLNEGASVMISGIKIGFVDKILLKKNHPTVIMKINKDVKITSDSSISIQTDGLFGSKFLLIELGGLDDYLKKGDSFSFAEDSILLQDLLNNIIKIGKKNKL